MSRFSRVLAVAGITGALAVGGAGVAQASTGHGVQSSRGSVQAQRHDKSSRDRTRHDKSSRHDSKSGNHR